jgi:anti-sigma factor RsiW
VASCLGRYPNTEGGRKKMRKRQATRAKRSPSGAQVAFRRATIGAMALGAFAVGATAIGALAIGALAIRALAVKRGRIERLNIEELEVGRLHVRELVVEQEQTPRQGASVEPS